MRPGKGETAHRDFDVEQITTPSVSEEDRAYARAYLQRLPDGESLMDMLGLAEPVDIDVAS